MSRFLARCSSRLTALHFSDITVLSNPAKFTDPYLFRITFECMAPLEEGARPSSSPCALAHLSLDLEWKLVYVGSAESESFDQELDTCMVGPVPVGVNSFEFEVSRVETRRGRVLTPLFQAAAPLPSRIPSSDLIGVTVILLTCSYAAQEFVRVGYYVNTEYLDPELKQAYDASLEEGSEVKAPDAAKHIDALSRLVLSEKPRVTRFNIKWFVHSLCYSLNNPADSFSQVSRRLWTTRNSAD